MIRMFPRRRGQRKILAGEDEVIAGISLPSDSVLNGVGGQVHMIRDIVHLHGRASLSALQGYILPVLDPDAGASLQTIWDTLVPKDDDVDSIDLDTGAADSQSFYEPGELSMAEVLDLGLQPQRIYHREFLSTYASRSVTLGESPSADTFEFLGAVAHRFRITRRYRVSQPSVVLFAVGNAALDDTTGTEPAALAENEWFRIKHIETMIEQALITLFGLTEAGATVTWDTAAALLRSYLEPDVFEETAGAWTTATLNTFTMATFDVSVPGTMDKITLGTGG